MRLKHYYIPKLRLVDTKAKSLAKTYNKMSFEKKCRFFCHEYGFFLIAMVIIAFIFTITVAYFCQEQNEVINDLIKQVGEAQKKYDEFERLAQEANEKNEQALKELEERFTKKSLAVFIPKQGFVKEYQYPLFKRSCGSIERPDFFSYEKNFDRSLKQPRLPRSYWIPFYYSKWVINQRIEDCKVLKNYVHHFFPERINIHKEPLYEDPRFEYLYTGKCYRLADMDPEYVQKYLERKKNLEYLIKHSKDLEYLN